MINIKCNNTAQNICVFFTSLKHTSWSGLGRLLYWLHLEHHYDQHGSAAVHQPTVCSDGQAVTRKAEPFWILMKQEMTGRLRYQQDHMQIISS